MSLLTSLSYWLCIPEVWIILGIIFMLLEVTMDGSMAIFLPLGLASLVNGAIIYLQETTALGADTILLDRWENTLISYAILAIAFTLAMRFFVRHKRTDTTPDVNDY